jgi:hypothetical protein
MILIAESYHDIGLYLGPIPAEGDLAVTQLAMLCKLVTPDFSIDKQDVDLNSYTKFSLAGVGAPSGATIATATLNNVVTDLLGTPKITVIWGVRPPFGLRASTGVAIGEVYIFVGNADPGQVIDGVETVGAITLTSDHPANPVQNPLVVYDPTDEDGTGVSKEGDPADHGGTAYWVCNPSVFTLGHELAHAWHQRFISDGSITFDQFEKFAQRIENEIRTVMKYRKRKIGGSTIIGKVWSLCLASDNEASQAAPAPPQQQYSWCYVATASNADFAQLRKVRESAALDSGLVSGILRTLYNEYYEFSPQLATSILSANRDASRTACDAAIKFWARLWRVEGVKENLPDAEQRLAAIAWLREIEALVSSRNLCWWALHQTALIELDRDWAAIESWWRAFPLQGSDNGSEEIDVHFDAQMQLMESPLRSREIIWRPPPVPPLEALVLTRRGEGVVVTNCGIRNVFVATRCVASGILSTSLLVGGQSRLLDRCPQTIHASYQPPYPGINVVGGAWTTAIAIDVNDRLQR